MSCFFFFFFNDPATTEIYTLSLHDALPIYHLDDAGGQLVALLQVFAPLFRFLFQHADAVLDRKSTRLNSSHVEISYAVFCLKKKIKITHFTQDHQSVVVTDTNYYRLQVQS